MDDIKDFVNLNLNKNVIIEKNNIRSNCGYICGYSLDKQYIIVGFKDDYGCVIEFNPKNVIIFEQYNTYRFVNPKYIIDVI